MSGMHHQFAHKSCENHIQMGYCSTSLSNNRNSRILIRIQFVWGYISIHFQVVLCHLNSYWCQGGNSQLKFAVIVFSIPNLLSCLQYSTYCLLMVGKVSPALRTALKNSSKWSCEIVYTWEHMVVLSGCLVLSSSVFLFRLENQTDMFFCKLKEHNYVTN